MIGRQDRAAGGDRTVDRAAAIDEDAGRRRDASGVADTAADSRDYADRAVDPDADLAAEIVPALAMPPVRVDALTRMAVWLVMIVLEAPTAMP